MITCSHYTVTRNGSTCIILDSNITGILHYNKTDNSTEEFKFNITGRMSGGSCKEMQYLVISFDSGINKKEWNLTIYFNQTDDSFQISNFTLRAYLPFKANVTEPHVYVMDEHAELGVNTDKNEAYKCSEVVLSFRDGATVNFHNTRLIAYAHLNATEFPENQKYSICQLDVRTSDLVPIVVGACLATLVIIVLIAYLVGRARAKRQGYASV
uniref:Lysosome-associated membrane glycoprotein 1 n=1 Tax=Setaria digitata TaxID=48799 RepID=A0A915Q7X3_9BILA